MSPFSLGFTDLLARFLTPAGRHRARLLREAEAAAYIASRRLEMTQTLADIGEHCLSSAAWTHRALAHQRPHLDAPSRAIMASLGRALSSEIDRFTRSGHGC
ncbi:hypothetical protein GCM10020369_06740 [Cryptosporangium minutisporangium]|uniref:Uncharacterized protein n=1 Tax=Cryptosporangium minutisporangium TaxID=113569 RepID=A0ABP6SR57_9ACTN